MTDPIPSHNPLPSRRPWPGLAGGLAFATLCALYFAFEHFRTRAGGGPGFVGKLAYNATGDRLAWLVEKPQGSRLAVWDLPAHRHLRGIDARDIDPDPRSQTTFTALAFSPLGAQIALAARSSPGPDPRILLCDLATGAIRNVLRGHAEAPFALAFSPDGQTLATAAGDREVRLWDVPTGRTRAILTAGHAPIAALAFAPDGQTLATGWGDRVIRIWDTATGELTGEHEGHEGSITALAFAPDGRTLLSAAFDGSVRAWKGPGAPGLVVRAGLPQPCRALAVSPDGRSLALKFAETQTGSLWDAATGADLATIAHAAGALAFAPRGGALATATGAGGGIELVRWPPAPSGPQ